jgi:hypothetical protein
MRSQSGRQGVCARDARSGQADRRLAFAAGSSRAHGAGEMGRNETKRKRNGELRFCADPPLRRSRSEADGFAILSVFSRLVVLLFRLGENGTRRAGDQSDAGVCRANAGTAGSRKAEGYSTEILTFRKTLFAPTKAARTCRFVGRGRQSGRFGLDGAVRSAATRGAKSAVRALRRRPQLTRRHRDCIVSLHRFIEAAHGQDR